MAASNDPGELITSAIGRIDFQLAAFERTLKSISDLVCQTLEDEGFKAAVIPLILASIVSLTQIRSILDPHNVYEIS